MNPRKFFKGFLGFGKNSRVFNSRVLGGFGKNQGFRGDLEKFKGFGEIWKKTRVQKVKFHTAVSVVSKVQVELNIMKTQYLLRGSIACGDTCCND